MFIILPGSLAKAGLLFYQKLKNRTLRGVLQADVARDKIILPGVEK